MKNPPHHAARAVGRMAPVLRIAIVFTVNHPPSVLFEKCGEARQRTALTARGGGRTCRYIELVVWPEGVVSGPRSSAWPCPLVAAGSPRVDGGLVVGPAAMLEVAYAVVIAALLVPPATGRPSHPPQDVPRLRRNDQSRSTRVPLLRLAFPAVAHRARLYAASGRDSTAAALPPHRDPPAPTTRAAQPGAAGPQEPHAMGPRPALARLVGSHEHAGPFHDGWTDSVTVPVAATRLMQSTNQAVVDAAAAVDSKRLVIKFDHVPR